MENRLDREKEGVVIQNETASITTTWVIGDTDKEAKVTKDKFLQRGQL